MTKDGKTLLPSVGNTKTLLVIPEGVTELARNALADQRAAKAVVVPTSVKRIGAGAFPAGMVNDDFKSIFYKGTKAEWKNIIINEWNDFELKRVTVYFYKTTKPSMFENTWQYAADGVTPKITHKSIF